MDTFAKLREGQEGCLMTKQRRVFTDEFKREAVALLASSGRPLMQIADELGIQSSMLRRWRNAVGVPAGASSRPETQATPAGWQSR